jgi:hypothetical protein
VQEGDDRIADFDQSLGLDVVSLPRIRDLVPHVREHGIRPAQDPLLVQTAPGAEEDDIRIEDVRHAGKVAGGGQVEERTNDRQRL